MKDSSWNDNSGRSLAGSRPRPRTESSLSRTTFCETLAEASCYSGDEDEHVVGDDMRCSCIAFGTYFKLCLYVYSLFDPSCGL